MATIQQQQPGGNESPPEATPVRKYVARPFEPPLFGKLGTASVNAHLAFTRDT